MLKGRSLNVTVTGSSRSPWSSAFQIGQRLRQSRFILNSRVRESEHMFALIGLVVASILAHSSTDVIIAHSFRNLGDRTLRDDAA